MKVVLSWLREFVPTDLDPDELAERINARGVKIEGVLRPWAGLSGVVVARVVEVRDHPNSDRLCVASVDDGAGEHEVVVGVRNMAAGDLVPWARPGSRVPTLPEALGERELRGVVSNGMLCSPSELAISADHGGILLLNDEGLEPGSDVRAGLDLDDAVLDIEVEPNRPDFLSVYGVAREVAAATGVALAPAGTDPLEVDEAAADVATVEILDRNGCPRYLARVIRGVGHRPSPLRAQARLTASGMRPISAVVDATNYTMLELGQPLHGFDLARLAGPGILVRLAVDGERLVTLDGVDRVFTGEDLLICDRERPVAVAGIMGGADAEVSETTTDVLLESAYFTRTGVLRTARRLDLHSEASYRFERGTDPEGVSRAADRCAALIASWAGGTVLRGAAGEGAAPERTWVSMRPSRASALVGYPISDADAASVFDALGMAHRSPDADRVEVEVPGYRVDIEREVDLIEEVARVQGYDRIASTMPSARGPGGLPEGYAFVRRLREIAMRAGLHEVRSLSFASEADLALFGDEDAIAVSNPLQADEGFLRTRLTPGLLRAAARNRARGTGTVELFEVGTVFRAGDPVEERTTIAFVLAGEADAGWDLARRDYDVLDAKGVVESLLDELAIGDRSLGEPSYGFLHPGRSASILIADEPAGFVGELHPARGEELDLTGRVALCELEVGALLRQIGERGFTFRDVPRYPPVRRDLAFVVPEAVPAGDVGSALEDAAGELLDRSSLFDVFRGGSLPARTKSLAFAVDLRAPDRTLTDRDADEVVAAIVERLGASFGAILRTADAGSPPGDGNR